MKLVNGYYTVVFASGKHITFRIEIVRDPDSFLNGKQVIGYLVGTDNTKSYHKFGFVTNNRVFIWTKFKERSAGKILARIQAAVDILQSDVLAAGRAYVLIYRKCFICNRVLTNPESVEDGIGPVCRRKAGLPPLARVRG